MDGENNGKPYTNGWFGGKTHYFWKHPDDELLPCQLYSEIKDPETWTIQSGFPPGSH